MAAFDLQAITLGDVSISGKGAKSAPLSLNGGPFNWQPDAAQVVYEPTSFSGEEVARVNLVMRANAEVERQLTMLDEYVIGLATLESVKLFGKPMSEEEVKLRYNPLLKKSDKGYPPTFKAKVNLAKLRCWDMSKQRREAPEAWTQCAVTPKILIKSLWFLSKEFGVLCEISDLLVDEASQECPL